MFIEAASKDAFYIHFEKAAGGASQNFETTFRNQAKKGYITSCTFIPIFVEEKVVGIHGIMKDITNLKESEEKMARMAYHDPLTGLPNRIKFEKAVEEALNQIEKEKAIMAVLYLDLDRFKCINDKLGHEIGDMLLCAAAERMQTSIRPHDMVSRQGGDEFTILVTGLKTKEDALALVNRMISTLSKKYSIRGHNIFSTPSIGIAFPREDGHETVKMLIKKADFAMYEAKKKGRNQYSVYDEEIGMQDRELEKQG
ncbi:GGDEF domain-containing protein [Thalassobacillus sp. C254]|uniref:GGDEF domain-containing protein n=1 Tax=Thalassobacillus sp. C254 TaxID=1225341 RepID=UPI0006D2A698|nr:GGDEF domain-containing protein [Thalassobacillus sp. C254]